MAKAANWIKNGAYIGITLGSGVAGLEIKKACTLRREDECRKAKKVEGTSLVSAIAGAGAGGVIGTMTISAICVALGVPTGGTGSLACAVMGGAIGGKYGGDFGSEKGRALGEILYEETLK